MEATMKLRMFIVLACTLIAVSGCVWEPGGYYRGGEGYGGRERGYEGGRDRGYEGGHEGGRRVWR
jgi:hypothetical protein